MNKLQLNLLPWREARDQGLLKRFLLAFSGYAVVASLIFVLCSHYDQSIQQEIFEKRTALEQIQRQLMPLTQQINVFQANYQHTVEPKVIPSPKIATLFQLLQTLPLQQGELTALQLQASQLQLTGNSANQEEFNQLHEFLRQQSLFSQIKLAQFKPTTNDIFFQFDLPIQEE